MEAGGRGRGGGRTRTRTRRGRGEIRWPRKEAAERKWRREGRLIVLLAGVSLSAEIHNCLICVTLAMK